MAVNHYENFPVASVLLPRRLRKPVIDIYRYARSADDIADEGDATNEQRLDRLAAYRTALHQIQTRSAPFGRTDPLYPVFGPLQDTVHRFGLPLAAFFDLLSAFEQDVHKKTYKNDSELLDYCSRSANPVGLLMLHLFQAATPTNIQASDSICTGLQLTNFWQDVAIDFQKSRVYLPQEKMTRYGVTKSMIATGQCDESWRGLMQAQSLQARQFLEAGLSLPGRLGGRTGFEIKLIIQGGLRILERLDELHYDMFNHRPTLNRRDWLLLLWRTLRPTPRQALFTGKNDA